jgi:hypothetical protein
MPKSYVAINQYDEIKVSFIMPAFDTSCARLGRRAKGEGRRAKGLEFRAKGEGLRTKGEGLRAEGLGLRV